MYTVLLDTGTSICIVKSHVLNQNRLKFAESKNSVKWNTPAGVITTNNVVKMSFLLDKFSPTKSITWNIHVARKSQDLGYDMIIGRDLLRDLGIIIDFSEEKLIWDNEAILIPKERSDSSINNFGTAVKPSTETTRTLDIYHRAVDILDMNIENINIHKKIEEYTYLSTKKEKILESLLEKYSEVFTGLLGKFKTTPAVLVVHRDAEPVHPYPFMVPVCRRDEFKNELKHLVKLGVLTKVGGSKWNSPSFLIPKTDCSVRFLTDFRKLNKFIIRKRYPLPKILDIMQTIKGFRYASKIDLRMGYYTIELDKTLKNTVRLLRRLEIIVTYGYLWVLR